MVFDSCCNIEDLAQEIKQREVKCALAEARLSTYLPSGGGYLNNATTFTQAFL
jgi:hypothetical protein